LAPLAEVDRRDGKKDLELRGELDHRLQKRRKAAQRVLGALASGAGRARLRRAPSETASQNRQSASDAGGSANQAKA
jgi:hypothetical protein